MAREINDDTLIEFIRDHLDVQDFGYLVVPSDERLNDEVLSKIKRDFKKFIEDS